MIIFVLLLLPQLSLSLNSQCVFPKNSGPCEAAIHRYFFNTQTKTCEAFIYGGCQGNPNNFETLDECNQLCASTFLETYTLNTPTYCYQAPDGGPCTGYVRRFYFDIDYGSCFDFIYGGCGGNLNNFVDSDTCLKTCSQTSI